MSFRVVLTGGIASGKTTVANEFASLGVTVIDTDQINRDVVAPGTPALAQIVATFGADALGPSGELDRAKMRARIFSDPLARKQLEAITHPAIRDELARRAAQAAGPYQIHVIPLFVEGGARAGYDRVLVVDCPESLQIERLMRRDGADLTAAQRALAAQATRAQRLAVADDVIVNEGDLVALRDQVRRLHAVYLRSAAAP